MAIFEDTPEAKELLITTAHAKDTFKVLKVLSEIGHEINNTNQAPKEIKITGIIRSVDDLGRIVLPREIRNRAGISEGTQLGIQNYDTKNPAGSGGEY